VLVVRLRGSRGLDLRLLFEFAFFFLYQYGLMHYIASFSQSPIATNSTISNDTHNFLRRSANLISDSAAYDPSPTKTNT